MPYSDGLIYAPVGIRDISKTVGVGSSDLGTLFTSAAINKWAYCKPVIYKKLGVMDKSKVRGTDEFLKAHLGFSIPHSAEGTDFFVWAQTMAAMQGSWVYNPPTGGSASPYRLPDCNGYYHHATKPFSTPYSYNPSEYQTAWQRSNGIPYAPITINIYDYDDGTDIDNYFMNVSDLKFNDINDNDSAYDICNCYLMAFVYLGNAYRDPLEKTSEDSMTPDMIFFASENGIPLKVTEDGGTAIHLPTLASKGDTGVYQDATIYLALGIGPLVDNTNAKYKWGKFVDNLLHYGVAKKIPTYMIPFPWDSDYPTLRVPTYEPPAYNLYFDMDVDVWWANYADGTTGVWRMCENAETHTHEEDDTHVNRSSSEFWNGFEDSIRIKPSSSTYRYISVVVYSTYETDITLTVDDILIDGAKNVFRLVDDSFTRIDSVTIPANGIVRMYMLIDGLDATEDDEYTTLKFTKTIGSETSVFGDLTFYADSKIS